MRIFKSLMPAALTGMPLAVVQTPAQGGMCNDETRGRPIIAVVVEDDVLLRMLAVDALSEAGLGVIDAGQAAVAPDIRNQSPEGIDLFLH
jgi:hypothetical protein